MRIFTTHEKIAAGFKLFLRMFVFGVLFSFSISALYFYNSFSEVNNRFVKMGFPETAFKSYIMNKILKNHVFFKFIRFEPESFFLEKGIMNSSVDRVKYNQILEKLFSEHTDPYVKEFLVQSFSKVKRSFKNGIIIFVLLLIAYLLFFSTASFLASRTKYIRGAHLLPFKEFLGKLHSSSDFTSSKNKKISIGALKIPESFETSHFLVLGTTGTGKSLFLNQMIREILSRNETDKLICYDVKGEFTAKWYREGDALYFPFDIRSIPYSLFNDIRTYVDYDILSKSLFEADRATSDPFFDDAAGGIFKAGLFWLSQNGMKRNEDILNFFVKDRMQIIKKIKELPPSFHGVINYIRDSRQGASVMSALVRKISFIEYLVDNDGDFSFRSFIQDCKHRKLFIPNITRYKQIFKPLISYAIDTMIREVLSLDDDLSRRIFFFLDEFGSLSKMDSVFSFLKESRSKGGSLIVANQDLGDIEFTYGRERKETFVNNFNSRVIFRINDPLTGDFVSKAIGEHEVYKNLPSSQIQPKSFGDRHTLTTQDKQERVILPSQLAALRNFECLLSFSNVGITTFTIPHSPSHFRKSNSAPFIEREFKIKNTIIPEQDTPTPDSVPSNRELKFPADDF